MNAIMELLPTKKVTAFVLGAAVAFAVFWLLVDVFGVIPESPNPIIYAAWTVIVGFLLAVAIPNSWWAKVNLHTVEEEQG